MSTVRNRALSQLRVSNIAWKKLDGKWKSQEQGETLESLTPMIMNVAIDLLKTTNRAESLEAMTEFLKGESKDHKMDDCVRWHILRRSVRITQDEGPESNDPKRIAAQWDISKIILDKWPYLAFESPYDDEESRMFSGQCVSHEHKRYKEKQTPFHVAAQWGNAKVIEAMISNGRELYDKSKVEKGVPESLHYKRPIVHSLLQTVQQLDSESGGDTALLLATKTSYNSLETLEGLLKLEGIATSASLNGPFTHALNDGLLEVIDKFLEYEQLAKVIVTSSSIIEAMDRIDQPIKVRGGKKHECIGKDDARTLRLKIVESLVSKATERGTFSDQVVQTIIKRDLMDIWKARPKEALDHALKPCLLHLAVFNQKYAFVDLFTHDYPNSVSEEYALSGQGLTKESTRDPEFKKCPLWYNNNHWEPSKAKFVPWKRDPEDPADSVRAMIRSRLVTTMIHVVEEMERLLDIFQQSDEPFGDLCFDISQFNSATYRVSDFVDSLVYHNRSQKLLLYEETLRYVEFPSLDVMVADRETYKENLHFKQNHTEVFRVLGWLWGKGVRTIVKLKVPDRLVNPHDDLRMASEVDRFKVEILDWKVPDLSISIFSTEARRRIKELHLYSSGKRAVISHWLSPEGVKSLPNLEILEIKIIQETCTLEYCSQLRNDIRRQVSILQQKKEDKGNMKELKAWVGTIESIPWYPTPKLANLSEIAYRVAPKLARWLTNLEAFVLTEKKRRPKYKPTKVAILDNGILSISSLSFDATKDAAMGHSKKERVAKGPNGEIGDYEGPEDKHSEHHGGWVAASDDDQADDPRSLWSRIQDGRSFVDEDSRLSPWLFASDPHGTQMANLICAIDPFCEIYVARVAEDTFGITSKRVAKAIEWAMTKDVDVISMSFVVGDRSELLNCWITKASEKGIVMTCSTHDEGSRIVEAFPAGYQGGTVSLMVLAACDEYGKLLREVDASKYHYMIRGQDVAAGVIPFLKSQDLISGSSVSTALAAGLCSLILTCDRFAHPGKEYSGGRGDKSRWAIVTEKLDQMRATGSKFVLLEKFGGIDTPRIGQSMQEGPESGRSGGPSAKNVLTAEFGY